MKARRALVTLLVGLAWSSGSAAVRAGFINGNFATGDLTGWTASAIDQHGNPVTPLISVASAGGANFAVFDTGTYAAGPFDSTLSQSFLVTAAQPILSFDLSGLPKLSPDSSGTGMSSFQDSFVASVFDGTNTHALLLIDASGALADPFGTAPGTVTLGPSLNSPLDTTFTADLSSLAGQTLTLNLDVTSQDDGSQSSYSVTNFTTSARQTQNAIPEPHSIVLASAFVMAGLCYAWKQSAATSKRER
jgi:hypothetical protein